MTTREDLLDFHRAAQELCEMLDHLNDECDSLAATAFDSEEFSSLHETLYKTMQLLEWSIQKLAYELNYAMPLTSDERRVLEFLARDPTWPVPLASIAEATGVPENVISCLLDEDIEGWYRDTMRYTDALGLLAFDERGARRENWTGGFVVITELGLDLLERATHRN